MKGQCFQWSEQYALDNPDCTICHAVVTQPCQLPPEPYVHAWVEVDIDGIIYCLDWQVMEAGHGGHWQGKGYPKSVFYELYHPERTIEYTPQEALLLILDKGHSGPWSEDFNSVIYEQLQRQKERNRTPTLPS